MDYSKPRLILCDTIDRGGSKVEVQVESFRFQQLIQIAEIRIIPFGVAIESKLSGDVRLGVTYPSQFDIEFFVHTKHEQCAFEPIGRLYYSEKDRETIFRPKQMVTANCLILRARYSTLTLAIFGFPAQPSQTLPSYQLQTFHLGGPPPRLPPQQYPGQPSVNQSVQFSTNVPPPAMRPPMTNFPPINLSHPPPASAQPPIRPDVARPPPPLPATSQPQGILEPGEIEDRNRQLINQGFSNSATNQRPGSPTSRPKSLLGEGPEGSRLLLPGVSPTGMHKSGTSGGKAFSEHKGSHIGGYTSDNSDLPGNKTVNSADSLGLYEDGEIQDVDYEDISNEDLLEFDDPELSAGENDEFSEDIVGKSSLNNTWNALSTKFDASQWRVNPDKLLEREEALCPPLTVFLDPSLTLYDLECLSIEQQPVEKSANPDQEIPATLCIKEECDIQPVDIKQEATTDCGMETSTDETNEEKKGVDFATRLKHLVRQFSDSESHGSKWIEELEDLVNYIRPALAKLTAQDRIIADEAITALVDWTFECLDITAALRQSDNTFILRHLKAGISLAGILASMNSDILSVMLERGVQNSLVAILESPLVATTLKLSLLRALDLTTRLAQGVEAFLGIKKDSNQQSTDDETEPTPFQKFVEYLFCGKTARVSFACSRLLNKVQFYETLYTFKELVADLVNLKEQSSSSSDVEDMMKRLPTLTHLLNDAVQVLVNAENFLACPRASLPCSVVFDKSKYKPHNPYPDLFHMYNHTQFFNSLHSIVTEILIDAHQSLSELDSKQQLKRAQILHSFEDAMCDLLEELSNNQLGLQYLASKGHCLTSLLRGVLSLKEMDSEVDDPADDKEIGSGEDVDMVKSSVKEKSRCIRVAHSVTYKILTLSYLDSVVRLTKKGNLSEADIDDMALIHAVFGLHILVHDKESMKPVVDVIAMDENVNTLLPLLEEIDKSYSTKQEDSEKLDKIERPVVLQLLPAIILVVLRQSDNVDYLDRYGLPLFALAKDSSSLFDLQEWLVPLKQLSSPSPFDLESLPDLIGQLKIYVDEIDDLPAGLLTLLRILRSVIIPVQPQRTTEKIDYIKYRYSLVEFYSLDGVPALVEILQKLTEMILPQWYQGIEHLDPRYSFIISILVPLLSVLCHVTQLMIRCRRSHFRDTTALLPLFNVYTVFCVTPMNRKFDPEVDKVRVLIIDTLLAYTQNSLPDEENEEGKTLDKSLWTYLLRELLKFTTTSSSTFISGLSILRELLPLPLPLIIHSPLSDEEIQQLKSARTLWSAHMLCVESEFRSMLAMLGCSSNPHVELLLRSLCQRIADLGTASCHMVAHTALRIVIEFWNRNIVPGSATAITLPGAGIGSQGQTKESKEMAPNDTAGPGGKEDDHNPGGMEISVIGSSSFSSQSGPNISLTSTSLSAAGDASGGEMTSAGPADTLDVSRAFNLLRLVLSVSTCKAAILNLLEGRENKSGDEEVEDYFSRLYPMMNSILCTHVSHDHHISTQEKLIGCLRQLLKVEPYLGSKPPATFSSPEDMECQNYYKPAVKGSKCTLSDLANCLPSKEHLALIVNDLTAHVNHQDQDLSTVHLALRVLVMIMDSDYGFCIVKETVNKHPDVFLNLIKRVNNTFSKDNPDCQLTLLTTLELLRTLVMTDDVEGETRPMRTQAITPQEIKDLLGWKKTEQIHPVTELNSLLKAYVEDEKSLEILLDSMDSLIALLETLDDDSKPFIPLNLVYPDFPQPLSLTEMFEKRPFFLLLSNLDSAELKDYRSYNDARTWLSLPAVPSFEDVGKPELIRCDLENLAYTCCSGFKLEEELAKGHQRDEDDALRHKKRRKGQDAIISTGKSNKKFVAPMRGRGFSIRSGAANSMNTRQDSFRSRPANTSRPPSMHVDDFVKMEQTEDAPNEDVSVRSDRSGQQFKSLRGGRGGPVRKPGGYSSNWEGRRNTSSDVKVLTGDSGDFSNADSEFRAPQPHSWNNRREHRHLRSLTK